MSAKLYGLGVGPGDPELLTLKAHRILRSVPVVAYPAPEGKPSFAREIVDEFIPDGRVEIRIEVSMSAAFPNDSVYDKAAAEITEHLNAGRDVAVLCEGDPFFYGSFIYLHRRLAPTHPCEIVPGVSSLVACAAKANLPLAGRNDILSVIPATLQDDQIAERVKTAESVAFIKVGRHLGRIRRLLEKTGRIDNAVYVERATLAKERVMPLGEIEDESAPYFSMILIGAA